MRNEVIILLLTLSILFSQCISTTYIQTNDSLPESEVVRIPVGNLRPLLILSIDNQKFPEGFGDYVVMLPGKHTIRIRSLDSENLQASVSRTFNAGTIVLICPGLNQSSHHNENLQEKERWSPFIREFTHNDGFGLSKASLSIKQDCEFGYQKSFPNMLVK